MSFFDDYQRTAESIKDQTLEENRRLMRKLSESQQSFELLKFVHFNKDINLETLNDIIVGCTGCLYSLIYFGKRIITNLEMTNPIYEKLMIHQEALFKISKLSIDTKMIPDYTVVMYPVSLSQMISSHGTIKNIVLLYPTKFVTPEVLESVEAFMIVYEVLINIVLTREKMIELIETDPLTKLLNRSSWNGNLEQIVRDKWPFFILIVDIDRFKELNDTYGHLKGDEVLRLAGTWLKSLFRSDDMVFRLGGDEFAVTGKINLSTVEGLLQKINGLNTGFSNTMKVFCGLELTISIGAFVTQQASDVDQIYITVDDLLYKSKENGRNTITIHNDML